MRGMIAAVAAGFDRDLAASLAQVERFVEHARGRGVRLIVLPECALGGYLRESDGVGLDLPPALDPDGPEIARLIAIAGEMVVCVGYTEQSSAGIHSSAICVSGDGVLGHQRKVHLPPAERFAYVAGSGFAAFDTPVGRIGMVLCYDKLFPEAARALAIDGADTICSLAAWPADRLSPAARLVDDRQTRHFDAIDQARAIENQVVWVSSNQAGPWGRLEFVAGAKVVDPDGVVLATTGTGPGCAIADVDVARTVADMRAQIDHLGDRRPEAYGPPQETVEAVWG